MKILVTGGAGFIGSHTVDLLVERNHDVAVLDNLATGKVQNLPPGVRLHRVDVRNPEVADVLAAERPEVVVHLAAQVGVPASIREPVYDGDVNVLGSIRLLEASRLAGVRKVVYASSCAVYGDPATSPVPEGVQPSPLSPYGASKLTVEHYLMVFQRLYGLDYTVLRYANIYGPRQDPFGEAGVISIFAEAVIHGRPVTIHGAGEQERDFVFVRDVATANSYALERGGGKVLNIGRGIGTTINALFRTMAHLAGYAEAPLRANPRPGDIFRMVLDPSAARSALDWSAVASLEEGLRWTLDSFRTASEAAAR